MANPQIQQPGGATRRTSRYERLIETFAARSAAVPVTEADLARCYAQLLRIRRVEEEIIRLYPADKVEGPVHLSAGQEAVSVAVCDRLNRHDVLFATDRGHPAYLAKAGDVKAMWAERDDKRDGSRRGKVGPTHLVDSAVTMMGSPAVFAPGLPDAVGFALAIKMRNQDRIVVCFFGEDAAGEGVTQESVKFAALHRLPILFVCENTPYAIHSPDGGRIAGGGLSDRFRACGIPSETEDSGDFLKMYQLAGRGIANVRQGFGPRFIEIEAARWCDPAALPGDQVMRLGAMLKETVRRKIAGEVEREIAEAIAESRPVPADEDVFTHVFAAK